MSQDQHLQTEKTIKLQVNSTCIVHVSTKPQDLKGGWECIFCGVWLSINIDFL